MRSFRWLLAISLVTALLVYLVVRDQMSRIRELRYDEFVQAVMQQRVQELEISGQRAFGMLSDGTPFSVQLPERLDNNKFRPVAATDFIHAGHVRDHRVFVLGLQADASG